MPSALKTLLLLLLAAATMKLAAADAIGPEVRPPKVVAAKFVQVRHLAELDMDVESRGNMVCELDNRLRWQVDAPVRSITLIDREKLTHFDVATKQIAVIEQKKFPWLKLLRDSLDEWLSGDPERLAKRFAVTFPTPRTLHLVPRDAVMNKICRSVDITLSPGADTISLIRITEEGGDTLDIRFSEVEHDPRLSPQIWRLPPQ